MPRGDIVNLQITLNYKTTLPELTVSPQTLAYLKNVTDGKTVYLRLDAKKKTPKEKNFLVSMKEADKFYLTDGISQTELVRVIPNLKAVSQGLGARVLYYGGGDTVDCLFVEFIVVRLPNIHIMGTGVEKILDPDFVYKGKTLRSRFLQAQSILKVFEELFETEEVYFDLINQRGGQQFLSRLHYYGNKNHNYVKALKDSFKRVQFLRSVSRYE